MEQEQSQSEVGVTTLTDNNEISNKSVDEVENQHDVKDNVTPVSPVSQAGNFSPKQPQCSERHVTGLERQLLLNNCAAAAFTNSLSNWTKVFLCALSVIIPGIGQIVGIIVGLVMVADDNDSDRRSYGAALLTVSVIVFIIHLIFWFLFALAMGPDFYY